MNEPHGHGMKAHAQCNYALCLFPLRDALLKRLFEAVIVQTRNLLERYFADIIPTARLEPGSVTSFGVGRSDDDPLL